MSKQFSRREMLKIGALAVGGAPFAPDFPPRPIERDPGIIGRVAYASVSVFDAPKLDARTVGYRFRDTLLNIYRKQTPLTGPAYNPLWYRVWGGYVHSGFIQEVKIKFNPIQEEIPPGGLLTEMTVPYSRPFSFSTASGWQPEDELRLYYGSNHWIIDLVEGPDKQPWYQISDELYSGFYYYVPAPHLRIVPPEETTPLSPDVPAEDKRIEVNLTWQILSAYEGDQIVMRTQVSTGITSPPVANALPTKTPVGEHYIYSKMPSKHMGIGRLSDTLADRALPGVPWTSFFAEGGYAIHGAYWHNNFGWPMSRGCINMRTDEAKWVYRWLTPAWDPHEIASDRDWEVRGRGTKIIISE